MGTRRSIVRCGRHLEKCRVEMTSDRAGLIWQTKKSPEKHLCVLKLAQAFDWFPLESNYDVDIYRCYGAQDCSRFMAVDGPMVTGLWWGRS